MKLNRKEIMVLASHVMQDVDRRSCGTFTTELPGQLRKFSRRDAKIAELAVSKLLIATDHGDEIELGKNVLFEFLNMKRR